MPTYEYRCKDCSHEFEAVQSFTDEPISVCPTCGGTVKKRFGNVGISFKGSGFYKTDTRSSGAKATTGSSSSSTDATDGGSSDAGSSSSSGDAATPSTTSSSTSSTTSTTSTGSGSAAPAST